MGLIPLGMLLALVLTVALGTTVARRSPPSREAAVAAGRTHAVQAAGAAIVAGAGAAVYVGAIGLGDIGSGILALLVPITFGLVHTVVLAVGELTWPRPRGEVRRARLVHRGLLDAAPDWLVRTGRAAGGLVLTTLVGGALLADDDGRHVAYRIGEGPGAIDATAGPFPGLHYGLPAAVGLAVLTACAIGALWIVATRPAVATSDEGIESALRRASAHRVLRVAVGVPLFVGGGLLFTGGRAVHAVASSGAAPGLLDAAGAAGSLLGGAAMVAGVVVACIRAPGVPADAPAVPAG